MYFTIFRSAREEVDAHRFRAPSNIPATSRDRRLEIDAMYFSRRARQERQASLHGNCHKSRQFHLELAEAYERRAHLITDKLNRRDLSRL